MAVYPSKPQGGQSPQNSIATSIVVGPPPNPNRGPTNYVKTELIEAPSET